MRGPNSAKDKLWTQDEIDRLIAHKQAGLSIREISGLLNRTALSVEGKLHRLRNDCEILPQDVTRLVIPEHVLADRDRRLSMQPRDLTALLMGDPIGR